MKIRKEKPSKVFEIIRLLKLRKLVIEEDIVIYGWHTPKKAEPGDYKPYVDAETDRARKDRAFRLENEFYDIIDNLDNLRGGQYPKHFTRNINK